MDRRPLHAWRLASLLAVTAATVAVSRCAADRGPEEPPAWSAELPGRVVYTAPGASGVAAVHRVDATGQNDEQLFENHDETNANALYPRWDDGGRRIRFTAMAGGVWTGFEMDEHGADARPAPSDDFQLLASVALDDDLQVDGDAIFAATPGGGRELVHRESDDDGAARRHISQVAWGPARAWLIFQACDDERDRCDVRIARRGADEPSFRVARGRHPSWTW
ncbi:MAG: hypothetical protein KC635_26185 [Myxococcales bacterium]|nr:hypothetical protein [Myxococcales bacterium]MCB9732060.1 hypothetical protein [Deltaproteobacteria bacterium]